MFILVKALSLLVSLIIFLGKINIQYFLYIFIWLSQKIIFNQLITRILLFIISSALIISFYAYDDSETGFEWIYNYGDRTVAIIYFVLLFFLQHVLFYLVKFIFVALKNYFK